MAGQKSGFAVESRHQLNIVIRKKDNTFKIIDYNCFSNFTIVMIFRPRMMECWYIRRLDRDRHGADAKVFSFTTFLIFFRLQSRFHRLSLLLFTCLGSRHERPMRILVERDFLNPGTHMWHPRRINHRKRILTDPGWWKGKLYSMGWHLEAVRSTFFHSRPDLIPWSP